MVRVVLVNPSHPGNIGAAARAMKTMGMTELCLVDPERYPDPEATHRASGADDVLASARVCATLEEALSGCTLVLGTSARERRIPWPLLDPRECGERVFEGLQGEQRVALVFGREYAGLTNAELQRCHFHVNIPSDPEFSSLNLAAAVQVLCYEVRMAWLLAEGRATKLEKLETTAMRNHEAVTLEDMELFYQHLQATLVDIGFLDPKKPRHLMARLRRLFGRSQPTRVELNILRGILTETRKTAAGVAHKRRSE